MRWDQSWSIKNFWNSCTGSFAASRINLLSWCAKDSEDLEQLVNLWISLTKQKCVYNFHWKKRQKIKDGLKDLEKRFGSNHLGHNGAQWPNVNWGGVLGTTKQDFRGSGKEIQCLNQRERRRERPFLNYWEARSPVPQSDHLVSVNPDRNSKSAGKPKISNLDHLWAMVFDPRLHWPVARVSKSACYSPHLCQWEGLPASSLCASLAAGGRRATPVNKTRLPQSVINKGAFVALSKSIKGLTS